MQRMVPIGNVVSEVMIKMLSVTYYDEDETHSRSVKLKRNILSLNISSH